MPSEPSNLIPLPRGTVWDAWFPKGVRYRSEDTDWIDLPKEGLQFVVFSYPDKTRMTANGADWYWIYDGVFGYVASTNDWGSHVDKPAGMCQTCIKMGTAIPDHEFEAILKEASDFRRW